MGCAACGHLACVCTILVSHREGCGFRRSVVCPIPVECEHGRDVCSICDPCTCGVDTSRSVRVRAAQGPGIYEIRGSVMFAEQPPATDDLATLEIRLADGTVVASSTGQETAVVDGRPCTPFSLNAAVLQSLAGDEEIALVVKSDVRPDTPALLLRKVGDLPTAEGR